MTLEDLKRSEAILLKLLFEYKLKLWESHLTEEDKYEIESRFNLLEKITFVTFNNVYNQKRNTIGNI